VGKVSLEQIDEKKSDLLARNAGFDLVEAVTTGQLHLTI